MLIKLNSGEMEWVRQRTFCPVARDRAFFLSLYFHTHLSIMTIIVYTGTSLIADQVCVRNGYPVRNTAKLHVNGCLAWGSAGYIAGPKLLAAKSLDALTTAYLEEQNFRKEETTLAYFDGSAYLGAFNFSSSGIASFDWTLATIGACVGSYAAEFESYQSRGGHARAFCDIIADLWGCPDWSFSEIDLLNQPMPFVRANTRTTAHVHN